MTQFEQKIWSGSVVITDDDYATFRVGEDKRQYAEWSVRTRMRQLGMREKRLDIWTRRCVPNGMVLLVRRKMSQATFLPFVWEPPTLLQRVRHRILSWWER